MDGNEIKGLEELMSRLRQIAAAARNLKRPLQSAGVYMLGSIERNFQEQGRPVKWTPLSARTLASRRGARKAKKKAGAKAGRGARILIDNARLKNSMGSKVDGDAVAVGTNVVYAARQNFGYGGQGGSATQSSPGIRRRPGLKLGFRHEEKGKGRRGQARTPARPFLVIQPQDIDAIAGIFQKHIARESGE
jgi:phage gpG-like protein